MCVCACAWLLEKGVRCPGAGIAGGCETRAVGAKHWTWILWKLQSHLRAEPHLSIPSCLFSSVKLTLSDLDVQSPQDILSASTLWQWWIWIMNVVNIPVHFCFIKKIGFHVFCLSTKMPECWICGGFACCLFLCFFMRVCTREWASERERESQTIF